MAAVEADVLNGMGTAGRGDNGVMVTTSQGAKDLAAEGAGSGTNSGNSVDSLLKQPLARKLLPWAGIALVALLGVIALLWLIAIAIDLAEAINEGDMP